MKKYFIPYGTISGKTFFLRSSLIILFYSIFLAITGFYDIEIGERYFNSLVEVVGNDIPSLLIYIIPTITFYFINTNLFIKRIRAFKNFKFKSEYYAIIIVLWIPIETGLFIRTSSFEIPETIYDLISYLLLIAFCFLVVKNSTITDSKQHEG